MKIVIICSLYKPYVRGGAEVVVRNIVEEFLDQENEVIVISSGPEGAIKREKSGEKICQFFPLNLFWFGNIEQKPIWLRLIWHLLDVFNWHSYFVVKKILKREKPDLICTHNLKGIGYLVPFVCYQYAKKFNKKYIHTIHDVQMSTPSGKIFWGQEKTLEHTNIFTKVYQAINRQLFSCCKNIISPSNWLLAFYQKRSFFKKAKTVVINNPIKLSYDSKKAVNEKKRNNICNFLFLGQVIESKGIWFLLKTFKKLDIEYQNWKLYLVGQGKETEKIKEYVFSNNLKTKVIFCNYVAQEKLSEIFIQVDWTIVPSLVYESFGMVVAESLSNSVPVIVSDLGGLAELVKDGYNGYSFQLGNEQELLEILKKCLLLPEDQWRVLSNNAGRSINRGDYVDKVLQFL